MSAWAAKRFWETADAVAADGGWQIRLDGRMVKTPAKAGLLVPSKALADEIAGEWREQGELVEPSTMPFTRSANAAIDKVAPQFEEVAALIAAYGETDLCCYRAEGPEILCQLQSEAWDEILDWSRETFQAPLTPTVGIVPVSQPAASLAALRAEVLALDSFALTALHDLVALSGSLLLGLAAIRQSYDVEALWDRSRVDERFQASQWGEDEEAAAAESCKQQEFLHAARFHRLSRPSA